MPFDFLRGADQARLYACKYAGKPEPWFFMETTGGEANPVKRFLQCRHVGMPMCHSRMLGFHVVRSTVPTLYVFPQFTVANKARIERNPEHKQRSASCPDPQYYCNRMQQYYFRNEGLRHLRASQFFRYFSHQDTVADRQPAALRLSLIHISEPTRPY